MQEEESLVKRATQHDQEAFAQLYEAHFDRIYRYVALRIGGKEEAEDVTQRVFLNALKAIPHFKPQGRPFSSWLYRIAHNQVVDHLRKKGKQPTTLPDESLVRDDHENNPELTVERQFDIEQLLMATRRLTKNQREVVSLRFAGELSTAEVDKIMGKSQGAVKALQHSAIVALRKALLAGNNE